MDLTIVNTNFKELSKKQRFQSEIFKYFRNDQVGKKHAAINSGLPNMRIRILSE